MLHSLVFFQFRGNVNEDDARDCFPEVQDWQSVNSNLFFCLKFQTSLSSFFIFAVFCFVYLNEFGTLNSLIYGFGVWISLILDPSDPLLKHNISALVFQHRFLGNFFFFEHINFVPPFLVCISKFSWLTFHDLVRLSCGPWFP